MKKIIGILSLITISTANASNCKMYIQYRGLGGDRMNKYVEKVIEKETNKLGYQRVDDETNSDFTLKVVTPSYCTADDNQGFLEVFARAPTGYHGSFFSTRDQKNIEFEDIEDVTPIDNLLKYSLKQSLKSELRKLPICQVKE